MPSSFSWLAYMEANFYVKYTGDFVSLACPFCNGDDKLHVKVANTDREWGWCFRCETWTDAVKFVMVHRGIERYEALEFIKRGEFTESLATALQRQERKPKPRPREEVLPKEFELVTLAPATAYGKSALRYLRKRKVTDLQLIDHGMGYCSTGNYHGCVIVPTTRDGDVVYFVARAFLRPGIKYLNPSKDEIGTGKSEVIFNYDRARVLGEGVVCEGVFDALAMGTRGMAIFGKSASDEQLAMLMSFKKLGVCLDNDATRERMELVEKLCRLGVNAYPLAPHGKDANESQGAADAGERSELGLLIERMGNGVMGTSWEKY